MKLFQCSGATLDATQVLDAIQTPLGKVNFDAVVSRTKVASMVPTQKYLLPSGGVIICWHQPDFDIELLICRPEPPMQSFGLSSDCWAGLWRLQAKRDIGSCNFTGSWEQDFIWTDQEPQSSQWVYARTWNDGQTEVSIGTEDEDALANRSHQGKDLPHEWEKYFRSTADHFSWFSRQSIHNELGESGLAVPLPPLASGETCQIQFVLAWSPHQEVGRSSSLEVERTAPQILAGTGRS